MLLFFFSNPLYKDTSLLFPFQMQLHFVIWKITMFHASTLKFRPCIPGSTVRTRIRAISILPRGNARRLPRNGGTMINGRYVTPKVSLIFRAFPPFRFTHRETAALVMFRVHFDALSALLSYFCILKEVTSRYLDTHTSTCIFNKFLLP